MSQRPQPTERAVLVTKRVSTPRELKIVARPPLELPSEDGVVVEVKACGVNFPDLLLVTGKYQFRPPLPYSPGGEVAGVVKRTGSKVRSSSLAARSISAREVEMAREEHAPELRKSGEICMIEYERLCL